MTLCWIPETIVMMRVSTLFTTTVLLVTSLVGCVASRKTIEDSLATAQNESLHNVSAGRDLPVVFTDNKALQYDTGAMDADGPE